MAAPLIQVCDVSKEYLSRRNRFGVLRNVNIVIHRGERLALVGPNGSGKTTLLRIILGIESPDTGYVKINPGVQEERVCYVPQDYRSALFPWLSLQRNLVLGERPPKDERNFLEPIQEHETPSYQGLSRTFRLAIDLKKYPYQLSGGEQQLFLIMRALVDRPNLLLFDEPLSAVDFGRKRLVHQYLGKWLSATGTTALLASHDFEEAAFLSDRVLVFRQESRDIQTEISVDFPWPRCPELKQEEAFKAVVENITAAIL